MRRDLVRTLLGGFVVGMAASAVDAQESPIPKLRSLRMEQLQVEFHAAQAAHDRWAAALLRNCTRLDSRAEARACEAALQPEIDRRQCAVFADHEARRRRLFGSELPAMRSVPTCERLASRPEAP